MKSNLITSFTLAVISCLLSLCVLTFSCKKDAKYEAENAAIRSGFLDPEMEMITKPFALDQLAAKICEMIER